MLEEQRRCEDEWHQKQLSKSWACPLPYYKIDNIEFTALTYGQALYEEGQRMQHCIFTYTDLCYEGKYLAFSVKYLEQNESKIKVHYSTLGLSRNIKKISGRLSNIEGFVINL
ncbi:PcfJ domain-containing protein [Conservatibacter flavescens]|uniref:PcfJ domain-containing protein n=1 Tax=Conservatibacter flavescens TaxID=28161 RepID=UPI001FB01945|nr:PcfJ domain-containing protein [Conservatibacter flavescens]